jgi:hypothetical protein
LSDQPRPFVPQFQVWYHAAITEQACPDDPTIRGHLSEIVAGNVGTDLDQSDSVLHFDNCTFALGVQRIQDLWQLIESDQVEVNRYLIFGTMIHTVQDFYAHSNWIELHTDQRPVPVWDLVLTSLPSGIVSGTYPDHPQECGPGAPTHAQLNKDSPNSEEGRKTVPSGPNESESLYDLAFATAVGATKVQFAHLQAVVGAGSASGAP